MKGKYIITTDAWFYAPDGKQYKGVWGEVEIVADTILGIKTNSRATNWYAKVGSTDNYIIVAGCQIHYACRCEVPPTTEAVEDYSVNDGKLQEFKRPNNIYIIE